MLKLHKLPLDFIKKFSLSSFMKTLLVICSLVLPILLSAQNNVLPSKEIVVKGEVEKAKTITIEEILSKKSVEIGDLTITNHTGEKRHTAQAMKGVLIKELLSDVVFKTDSPKYLSEFYFTFVATDGYKVVYSWNEIYNSQTGDNIYIVTEKDGKSINEMSDGILSVCTTDFKTGRRHVKTLSQIIVSRVQ